MKPILALLAAVTLAGCSPQSIRIGADVFEGVCTVVHGLTGTRARHAVAYDVYQDGTVRPLYRAGSR